MRYQYISTRGITGDVGAVEKTFAQRLGILSAVVLTKEEVTAYKSPASQILHLKTPCY